MLREVHLTNEERDQIARQYEAGWSEASLETEWRISSRLLGRILDGRKTQRRPKLPHGLTDVDRKTIAMRYDAGQGLVSLAAEWHLDKCTVKLILKEFGIYRRGEVVQTLEGSKKRCRNPLCELKPLSDFTATSNLCRPCVKEYNQDYVKDRRHELSAKNKLYNESKKTADPEGYRAERRRAYLWTNYRITPERFDEMLSSQGRVCLLCFEEPSVKPDGSLDWHVDHDHKCCPGRKSCGLCVRGILCEGCNKDEGIIEKRGLSWILRALRHGGTEIDVAEVTPEVDIIDDIGRKEL